MTDQLCRFHEKLERTLDEILSTLQTVDIEIDTDPNLSSSAVNLQECIGRALNHNEQIIKVIRKYLEAQR